MKKELKTTDYKVNEMETSNLLDTKFKTLAIRTLNEIGGRIDKLNADFNKEIENIKEEIQILKKNESKIITEMKKH